MTGEIIEKIAKCDIISFLLGVPIDKRESGFLPKVSVAQSRRSGWGNHGPARSKRFDDSPERQQIGSAKNNGIS